MPRMNDLLSGLPKQSAGEQRDRYLEWWQEYGATPAGLAWNKGKQAIRFDVLLDFFDLEGQRLLDVGCGFGDLNKAIQFRTENYRYLGIDLVAPYLEEAEKRYGGDKIAFRQSEFLAAKFPPEFDIGIASGTFNFAMEGIDQYEYLSASMGKMLELCTEGIAIDMLSDRVNFKREGSFYYSPIKVLELALSYSRNVQIRHDYLPFEFAVAVFRNDSFDDQSTVFTRHILRKRPLVESGILS